MSVTVSLPWPSTQLSQNGQHGHWRTKARAIEAARWEAFLLALEADAHRVPGPHRLAFAFHPPTKGRRDVANMPGRLKAQIDGIADALRVDDSTFRVRFPEAFSDVVKGGRVDVEVQTVEGENA